MRLVFFCYLGYRLFPRSGSFIWNSYGYVPNSYYYADKTTLKTARLHLYRQDHKKYCFISACCMILLYKLACIITTSAHAVKRITQHFTQNRVTCLT